MFKGAKKSKTNMDYLMKSVLKKIFVGSILLAAIISNGKDKLTGILFTESLKKDSQEKFVTIQEKLHGGKFKILTTENLGKELSECEIVISNKLKLSTIEIDVLKKYVEDGGFLVAVGAFGQCTDEKYDSRGSFELSGCKIESKSLSIVKLRVLGENPIFKNFFIAKWLDYPEKPPVATTLQSSEDTVPLAIADFRPWGYSNTTFKYGYFASRIQAKVGLYAGFKSIGKGLCLRISDDLLENAPQLPLLKAFWTNLLETDTFEALKTQASGLDELEIYFDNDSMIPNGNFEKLCLSTGVEKVGSNCATGDVLMPQNWWFNSWDGKFSAQVIVDPANKDNHIVQTSCTDTGSLGGGSLWLCQMDYIKLVPGKKYNLSAKAKGRNIYKANFGITTIYVDGKRQNLLKDLPAGDFDWQDFNLEFTIDSTKKLKRGFRVQLGLNGNGIIQFDDFNLTEVE